MSTTSLVSIAYAFAILRARTREEGKTPVGREFVITSSKKRERKGIIRGRQIAVTALQDVFARARTWCSGGAGAMTGTDRTNRIVRRNPLFFFNSATFSAFASALHPRNSWIERGPTRPPLASIPNRDLEISRCAISVLLARIATPLEKSRVRCFRELSVNWFRSGRGRGIKSFIGRFSPENFTRLTRLFLKRRKKTGSIYFGSLELKRTGNIFLPRFLVIGFSKRTRTR